MDLTNARDIKALLEENGFHFSKAKGQNFLTASWVPRRIAEEAGVDRDTGVLEVGPGIGPLTEQLCLRAGKVLAVELDQRLKPILMKTVGRFDTLELRFTDVMDLDLAATVRDAFPGLRPIACANLPYYITSPILTRLLEARAFDSVTVMIQKEVAQRICAAPGTGAGGAFTVFCHWYAEPKLLFDVPPSCFLPQPKVTSAVITLKTRHEPPCPVADEALFFKVVRAAFAQRRKTLANALSSGFPNLGKERIAAILADCGLSPTVRGEALTLEQFAAIANRIGE
ncbi:MAG: 16S rRNA (adenine(1518)-N(6)/adenine(1519)-N(6))-dimethyltransferase RsmA [Oscillospiraceae bacterium]|nr:16S rRNA (adenine(1518)-N(6)/adenine(1519)-N(6))-dimethyltransferase RsmA [Oscillospiraceae bacterium]